jgi:hypothetical protein
MRYNRGFKMNRRGSLSLTLVLATALMAAARQDVEPLPGIVKVQADVNAVVCNNRDERFTINGAKEPVRLPAGKYHIESWNLERISKNGDIWELRAKETPGEKTFYVAENAQTMLPIGEPFVSGLIVRKGDSEFYFRYYLKGRLGEDLELTKNQSRTDPPKLLIRNEDGSYQETLTFKYG